MITDEQVRIALQVWFQDEGYEPSAHTMQEMRAALEAAVGDADYAVANAGGGWSVYNMTLRHPTYGTFWVYPGHGAGSILASHCYMPKGATGATEAVNNDLGKFETLADAKAAVAQRIAELDAAQPHAEFPSACAEVAQ